MKAVVQEEPMGCSVACVASLLGISYKSARALFKNPKDAITKGYSCKAIANALEKGKQSKQTYMKAKPGMKFKEGDIVYISKPLDHYLLKTKSGWMNSWINYPKINPARAGFQKKLIGPAEWIVLEK